MEWVTVGCLILSLPWWLLMAIRGHVALLIASLAAGGMLMLALLFKLKLSITLSY
jgi:hypothetical protein